MTECGRTLERCAAKSGNDGMTAFKFNVALCPNAETIRTIKDGEPRTSASTFAQLLSSDKFHRSSSMLLYVHRDRKDY